VKIPAQILYSYLEAMTTVTSKYRDRGKASKWSDIKGGVEDQRTLNEDCEAQNGGRH
jgi:hypothetical protein